MKHIRFALAATMAALLLAIVPQQTTQAASDLPVYVVTTTDCQQLPTPEADGELFFSVTVPYTAGFVDDQGVVHYHHWAQVTPKDKFARNAGEFEFAGCTIRQFMDIMSGGDPSTQFRVIPLLG